ncbi:hypothetical protein D9611_013270 [Ephemerocybe angulata]|uniref:Arrestin C-terminal-like domain-containing protein n=1 Tax=Ephemerocybe angulata TaxID=980116 RepID=A0A8H5FIJ8_9AGAR|nr:hypothetical protein D9611_013270 [Tulosesus angulatus]
MPSSSIHNGSEHDGDNHSEYEQGRFSLSSSVGTSLKDKAHIDIVLDTPYLTLKGTGPDVEPTRLSGNVILYLAEATSIKEITLQFRGKARIPVPANESLINNQTALTYIICHHNWSFLEGSAKHTRTLKAGRHFFPFHLEVGGSLPSSISTPVLGGASVAYKLRAVATRPLLAHNLQSMISVPLIRSFTPEALEYQQTLEIENTWPEKLMYSVVLPQKAWGTGDTLGSLVKLCPLSKGVVVETILMNLLEITKIYARSGNQDHSRVVASSRHDFIEGRPVLIEANKPWLVIGQSSPLITPRQSPPGSHPTSSSVYSPPATRPPSPPLVGPMSVSLETSETPRPPRPSTPDVISSDIITALFLPLPDEYGIVPSHTLEPITVTHRVRWSIYIRNPDAHVSELRCSLPITILHKEVLNEVRSVTRTIRRTVLAPGLETAAADTVDSLLAGAEEEDPVEMEDRELPSYNAHVRDRVANMYLPEAATMRITNPWVVHGTSPVSPNFSEQQQTPFHLPEDQPPAPAVFNTQDAMSIASGHGPSTSTPAPSIASVPSMASIPPIQPGFYTPPHYVSHGPVSPPAGLAGSGARTASGPTSGYITPVEAADHIMQHLPHAPGSGETTPLDWINSELMMSLSEDPRTRFGPTHWHGVPDGTATGSRGPSRPGSPERRPSSRPMSPVDGEHPHRGKGLGGFFKGAMKGLTKHHHGGHSGQHLPWNTHAHHAVPSAHVSTAPHTPRPVHDARPALFPSRSGPALSLSGLHHPHQAPPTNESQPLIAPVPTFAFQPPVYPRSGPTSRASSPFHTGPSSHGRSSSAHYGNGGGGGVPGSISRTSSSSGFPTSPALSSSSNDAMLHRAFTEVPDYSIAARGFIGGVPPLSSMRGLPSYEESARECLRSRSSEMDQMRTGTPDGTSSMRGGTSGGTPFGNASSQRTVAGVSNQDDRRVASDGDLVRRFQSMGMGMASAQMMSHLRDESGSGTPSGESSEDDHGGIQIRRRGT